MCHADMVQGRNTICLPVRQQPEEAARFVTLDILHRFEFDAELMMSGTVARTASAKQEEAQVFLKGTPHAVAQLVAHNRLPQDWARVSLSVAVSVCRRCHVCRCNHVYSLHVCRQLMQSLCTALMRMTAVTMTATTALMSGCFVHMTCEQGTYCFGLQVMLS